MSRDDTRELKARAKDLGFIRVGVAAAGPSPHRHHYLEWLDREYHGTMDYMAKNVARRIDPRATVPDARSVVVVALPYSGEAAFPSPGDTSRGKISRYARGRDYHKVLRPLLKSLAIFIAADGRWRVWHSVDTGPILERDWAEAAGVGWIGKNGMVLDAELGSWFFLGVLVTDRPFRTDTPATDHCGTCRACLDVCPTDAFVRARFLDARRCISYQTIEHRGEIDPEIATKLEGWVFGCDLCQEVCPFNRRKGRVTPTLHPDLTARPLPDDLRTLAQLDRKTFLEAFRGTSVPRTGVAGLTRNARAVLRGRDPDE